MIVAGLQRLGSGVAEVKPKEVSPDQLKSGQLAATNRAGTEGGAVSGTLSP